MGYSRAADDNEDLIVSCACVRSLDDFREYGSLMSSQRADASEKGTGLGLKETRGIHVQMLGP